MSAYAGDYSKKIMPYGSGSTRGMTQMHYEAIADTLRTACETNPQHRETVLAIAQALAGRLAAGNDRFRPATFMNAITNAAYRER